MWPMSVPRALIIKGIAGRYMSTLRGPIATSAASKPSSQGESGLRCRWAMGGGG